MNKPNVTKFFKTVEAFTVKHGPEILTGLGITGMITTTVLAVKATPKALRLIEAEKEVTCKDELTPIEVVKVAWKPYIPATITCVTSAACLIGANSVHTRRHAALATAYKLSETALAEYKAKVVETIGEKKEKIIKDNIAKDKVEKNPVDSNTVIITGKGDTLCLDGAFGQYFKSDIDNIKRAVNNINYRLLSEDYVSLNEFYDELGIDHIDVGDMIGWNISKHGQLEVYFSYQGAKDGTPCVVIEYNTPPQYDYNRFS